MSRIYRDYPANIEVQTKLGTAKVAVTDRDHVYVESVEPFVVFRVPYFVTLHLFRQQGEMWAPQDVYSLYARRAGSHDHPSAAARDRIVQTLTESISVWASLNPHLFDSAQKAHINNDITCLEGEISELERKLSILHERRDALLVQEAKEERRVLPKMRRSL